MLVQENVSLKEFTKFRIGGTARYFVTAKKPEDVHNAVVFAQGRSLAYVILAGGSNVLVSDNGFDGVVIHIQLQNINWQEDEAILIADAGVSWDTVVEESVKKNYFGLENLSGIPGSVGGAAVGNIGAYGCEVKDTIKWVEVFDPSTMLLVRLTNDECHFTYRHSIFKEEKNSVIVLRVAFQLQRDGELHRDYKDVVEYEEHAGDIETLLDMRKAILAIRAVKFPKDNSVGTAGSYFKNPIVTSEFAMLFHEQYPNAPVHDTDKGMKKLSAAWIIDHVLHLRGVRDGDVGTWESQALVLINYGDAQAKDISLFAKNIIDACYKETGVILTPEVVTIGEIMNE